MDQSWLRVMRGRSLKIRARGALSLPAPAPDSLPDGTAWPCRSLREWAIRIAPLRVIRSFKTSRRCAARQRPGRAAPGRRLLQPAVDLRARRRCPAARARRLGGERPWCQDGNDRRSDDEHCATSPRSSRKTPLPAPFSSSGRSPRSRCALWVGMAPVRTTCAYCGFTVTAALEQARDAFEQHRCDRPRPVASSRRRRGGGFALRL
jgi:hypothetical protein